MGMIKVLNPEFAAPAKLGGAWFKLKLNQVPESTRRFFREAEGRINTLKADATDFKTKDARFKETLTDLNRAKKTWGDGIETVLKTDLRAAAAGHDPAHIEQVAAVAKKAATDTMAANQNAAGVRAGVDAALRDWVAEAPINKDATITAMKAQIRGAYTGNPVIDNDGFTTNVANQVRDGWTAGESEVQIRTRVHNYLNARGDVNAQQDGLADAVRDGLLAQKTAVRDARQAVVNDINGGNLDGRIGNNFAQLTAAYTTHDAAIAARGARALDPELTLKSSGTTGSEALGIKLETADGGSVKAKLPKRKSGQDGAAYMQEQEPRIRRLLTIQERNHANGGQVSKRFFQQGGPKLTDEGMQAHEDALAFFEDGTRKGEFDALRTGSGVDVKAYGRSKPTDPDTLKVTTGRTRWGFKETSKVALPKKDTLAESLEAGKEYAEAFETGQRKRVSPSLMTVGESNPFNPARLSKRSSDRYTGINNAIEAKGAELTALKDNHGIAMKAKRSGNGAQLRVKQQSMDGRNWLETLRLNKTRHLPLDPKDYQGSVDRAVDYADRLTTESHPDINPRLMREKTGNKAVKQAGITRFDEAKAALTRGGQTQTDIGELSAQGISLRVRGNGEIQVTHKGGGILGLSKKHNMKMTRSETWEQFVDRAIKAGQDIMDSAKSTSSSGY